MRFLITGATGFVGGHVAQACVQRGHQVVAVARPTSDVQFLQGLGITIHHGQLDDAVLIRKALDEVDVVVNCAAKVGDWGPVAEYRKVNVDALRVLLDACKGHALSRFIHMSSLGVYAARHHHQTDESVPLPAQHRDGYSQSKMEGEKLALGYYHDYGVPVVVLRPGFVYGPRDNTVLPRIIDNLRQGRMRYPGGGKRALNTIYVGNLIDALFLAVERESAVGQVYNLTDGEYVSKRQFIETIADSLGIARPRRTPPLWLAYGITWGIDSIARMRGAKEAPAFNLSGLKFMAFDLDFSIEKAKRELGYRPRVGFKEAMAETLGWIKNQAGVGV